MAKTTGKPTGTRAKRKPQKPPARPAQASPVATEVQYLIVAALGILLLLSVYVDGAAGAAGAWLRGLLVGLLGFAAYALPILFIGAAVYALFSHTRRFARADVIQTAVFFWCLISLLHVVNENNALEYTSVPDYLRAMYDNGRISNGGLMGALLGNLLRSVLSGVGAGVVLTASGLIALVLLTGRSFTRLIPQTASKLRAFFNTRDDDAYDYDEDEDDLPPMRLPPVREKPKPAPARTEKSKNAKPRLMVIDDNPTREPNRVLLINEEIKKHKPANPVFAPRGERTSRTGGIQPTVPTSRGHVIDIQTREPYEEPPREFSDSESLDWQPTNSNRSQSNDEVIDIAPRRAEKANAARTAVAGKPEALGETTAEVIAMPGIRLKGLVEAGHPAADDDTPHFGGESFFDDESPFDDESLFDGSIPFSVDDRTPFDTDEKVETSPSSPLTSFIESRAASTTTPAKRGKAGEKSVSVNVPTVASLHYEDYQFPSISLLTKNQSVNTTGSRTQILENSRILEETLRSFRVEARVVEVSVGPTVTRYDLAPGPGVKVSAIANLSNDLALSLAAQGIRIEAPIPGKAAVGIEIPNREPQPVLLREIIEDDNFQKFPSRLAFAVGKDIAGNPVVTDVARMPHLLIAGATGSGKSVCINTLITSLLYKSRPDEVKLLMIDPKVVELSVYNGVPHLLIPVVTDPKKASGALQWAVAEMENRYALFAATGVRELKSYNAQKTEQDEDESVLPQIVIIIDELADLMMVCKGDVEESICRLAQKARAAGIHLIVATQRPSVDVITGLIKANIPSRLAFAVSSGIDSRTVLDMYGAEKLLGKGDMLFLPAGQAKPIRLQGGFISDKEVESVVDFLKAQTPTEYPEAMVEQVLTASRAANGGDEDLDPFFLEAVEFLIEKGKASTSMLQRQFRIGYNRASRLMEDLEDRGIVGPEDGVKPRKIMITREEFITTYQS